MDVDIEFIFDVVSPTAYLAWKVLLRYRPVWHLNVRYKPVFQGGIMQATGNQPPGMLPSRGMFLLKDMERTSSWYQVPMLSPPSNLFTLGAQILRFQRCLVAARTSSIFNISIPPRLKNIFRIMVILHLCSWNRNNEPPSSCVRSSSRKVFLRDS